MVPLDGTEQRSVARGDAVAGDHHVMGRDHLVELLAGRAVRAVVDHHAQLRGEAAGLGGPVAHHGGRRDHERGPGGLVASVLDGQEGEQLQGLAQAHVVGEHAAEPVARHPVQPVHTAALVLAQLGVHGLGQLDALGGLLGQRSGAADQRGVPVRPGDLDGVLGQRLERQLAQLGNGDLAGVVLGGGVEGLAGLLELAPQARHGRLGVRRVGEPGALELGGQALQLPLGALAGALRELGHVVGDPGDRGGVGQHPLAAQADQPGLGVDQLVHLGVGQLGLPHRDPPVVVDELVHADVAPGRALAGGVGLAGLQVRVRLEARPRLGQHDGHAVLAQACGVPGDEVDDLGGRQVDVPVAHAPLPRRLGVEVHGHGDGARRVHAVGRDVEKRGDLDGPGLLVAGQLQGAAVELPGAHGLRGADAAAQLHTHRPQRLVGVDTFGLGVVGLLDDGHQLHVDAGDRLLPGVQPVEQAHPAATNGRGLDQRAGEVVAVEVVVLLGQVGQERRGDPVRPGLGDVLVEVAVVDSEHTRRGRGHGGDPAALVEALRELPLRVPVVVLVGQLDHHAPGAHEAVEAAVHAHQPHQVRGDRLALRLGGRGPGLVEELQAAQQTHRLGGCVGGRRDGQGDLAALRGAQRGAQPVTEGRGGQQVRDRRRERALGDRFGHDDPVAGDLLDPQVQPGALDPQPVQEEFGHRIRFTIVAAFSALSNCRRRAARRRRTQYGWGATRPGLGRAHGARRGVVKHTRYRGDMSELFPWK